MSIYEKLEISQIDLFDYLSIYHKLFLSILENIFIALKLVFHIRSQQHKGQPFTR